MRVILAADHGGFNMKNELIKWIRDLGYEVMDVGPQVFDEDDDYVDYAAKAAESFVDGDKLVLFCRNGMGMCITANRFSKVRCGLAFDLRAVEMGRKDDDINAISIPVDYMDVESAKNMIKVFLESDFKGEEKYLRRLHKLMTIK